MVGRRRGWRSERRWRSLLLSMESSFVARLVLVKIQTRMALRQPEQCELKTELEHVFISENVAIGLLNFGSIYNVTSKFLICSI